MDLWRRVAACVCVCVSLYFEYSYAVESGSRSTRFANLNGSPIWPPVLLGHTHTSVQTKIRPYPSPCFSITPLHPCSWLYSVLLSLSPSCSLSSLLSSRQKYLREAEGLANYHHLGVFLSAFYLCICRSCQLPKESRHTICYDLCTPAFV